MAAIVPAAMCPVGVSNGSPAGIRSLASSMLSILTPNPAASWCNTGPQPKVKIPGWAAKAG